MMQSMGTAYDNCPAQITPKTLARNASRSQKVWAMHKVQYPAQASMRLKRMAKVLSDAMERLKDPVDKVVGKGDNQCVVKVWDYDALTAVIRTLSAVVEQHRIILRIPSPGRDTALEQRTVDITPADIAAPIVMTDTSPAYRGESAGGATQAEPEAAGDSPTVSP